jgi:hypothetical protein
MSLPAARRFVRQVALVASTVAAWPCAAELTVTWTPVIRQEPFARLEAPLTYDELNQRAVVFGGYDHNFNRFNDIWEYDAVFQSWRDVTPTSGPLPPKRSGSSMAFVPGANVIILFGGLDDGRGFLGDTWEWNCATRTWTNVTPAGSPAPREGVRLEYDIAGGRLLLTGGRDQNRFYDDTWAWNASARTWTQLTLATPSSPWGRTFLRRAFHDMAYNKSTGRMMLFSGEGFVSNSPTAGTPISTFSDLWELNPSTNRWEDRSPADDPAGNPGGCTPANACPGLAAWRPLVWDASANRMITYAGFFVTGVTAGNLKETWAWNGSTWTQLVTNIAGDAYPGFRDSHDMIYDPRVGRMVMYGGYLSDLWELTGSTWTSPPGLDPRFYTRVYSYPRQDYAALTYDNLHELVCGHSAGASELWCATPVDWSWTIDASPVSPAAPLERVGHALAFDHVHNRFVLFGGRCKSLGMFQQQPDGVGARCGVAGTWLNDTYIRPKLGNWSAVIPTGPMVARWDHTMVYDAQHDKYVMFGGRNAAGAPLSDTWLLTCNAAGTSCSWSAGPAGPPARYGHAMALDPARQRIVVFGGQGASGRLSDVWEWNGATSTWANVTPAGTTPGVTAPTARVHAALAKAHPVVPGLLLFGGHDGAARNDAWVWNGTAWQPVTTAGYAPAPRENPEMVFSPLAGKVIMQGGFDAAGLLRGELILGSLSVKGDLDASGTTDLVLKSPATANPVVWTMNGVTRLAESSVSAALAANEEVVGVDDFNFDGWTDLVVWNAASGQLNFWLMNGLTRTAVQAVQNATPRPLEWRVAATADFTHDGKIDLLWRNVNTQKLEIWSMNGTQRLGAYPPSPDQAIDSNWQVIGALDYNADSNTDLLWYNPNSGKIVFWFMGYNAERLTGQFANPSNAGDNNWKVLAAGDYGAGGGPVGSKDVVWRNETSGRFVVWYMDYAGNRVAGTFTSPLEPSPSPTGWTIVGPR